MKSIIIKAISAFIIYSIYLLMGTNTLILQSCCEKLPPIDTFIKPKDTTTTIDSFRILNYQPTSNGSIWKYAYRSPLGDTILYTLTCSNRDTTLMDSKIYRVFDGTQNTKEYHMVEDTFKYWTTIPGSSLIRPILLLKSNAAVGETWVGAINGNDTYHQTVVSKNIDYTLDGFTFKNVIVINQKRITNNQTTLNANLYIAAGYGLVHSTGIGELKLIYANIK